MLFNHDLYNLTQEFQGALVQGALAAQTPPTPNSNPLLQLRLGYAESPSWLMVQAEEFDPEPLTVERLRVRAVWSSARIVQALLDLMTTEKWFDRIGDEYHLTEDGRQTIKELTERRQTILSPVTSHLDRNDSERLENLMKRVLDACENSPEPPDKWCLRYSRRRTPPDDAPNVLKLFQYCADFNAYRDDAHMAAFLPLGIEAFIWEAMTEIWRGNEASAQSLFNSLSYRGYSRHEYAAGLASLADQGLLKTQDDELYQITDNGRYIREEAERKTDKYFYAPWKCLADAEAQELQTLMHRIRTNLESI